MKLPIIIRVYKGDHIEVVKQFNESQIVIGRAQGSQLQLNGDKVSPLHSMIEERDNGYYLSDLGSSEGTFLGGIKVLDSKIESGMDFLVGEFRLEFYIGVPKPASPPVIQPTSVQDEKPTIVNENEITKQTNTQEVNEIEKSFHKESNVKDEALEETSIIPSEIPKIVDKTPEVKSHKNENIIPPIVSENNLKNIVYKEAKRSDKGTYAPPSHWNDLTEILKPGKGTTVEVVVAWQERVISTHHFQEREMIRVGSSDKNQIVAPLLGSLISHPLIKLEGMASVCIGPEMTATLITENETKSFSELTLSNRMIRNSIGYEMMLQQGEMVKVSIKGGIINFYIRYVPEAPKPILAPLLDLTASETTGVILAVVISLIFGLYMMVYSPKKLNDETLIEEPLRRAIVTFKPPKPTPIEKPEVAKVEPVKNESKKVVKVVDNKTVTKAPQVQNVNKAEKSGKAGEAKPNPNKTNKKVVTSSRSGGAIKTGKSGASPSSENVDVSQVGLLKTFGAKGTQSKLEKSFSGAGALQGMADSATGYAGQEDERAGDDIGSKLKSTGKGGKGSSTVGISGVGTAGKGSGTFGYGTGSLGDKTRIEVQVSGQEAEIIGSMDREAIRRVILNEKRVIRNCYELALQRNPDLYGKIVLQWDIEERGKVGKVEVISDELSNPSVAECLVRRLKTWKFPDPPTDQIGQVIYPFVFSAQ